MKNIISFLLLLTALFSKGQTITVFNDESRQPVPYASVYLLKNDKIIGGIACDYNGKAQLPAVGYERIKVSCIGYTDLVFFKEDLKEAVYLSPIAIQLKEVVLGYTTHTFSYEGKKGRELGIVKDLEKVVYFENTYNKPLVVKKFSFKLEKVPVYSKARFIMYSVKDSLGGSFPGENILNTDVIIDISQNDIGTIEVDLQSYNVIFPDNGAFVGIDVLQCFTNEDGKLIPVTYGSTKFVTIQKKDFVYFAKKKYTNDGWVNVNKEWVTALKANQMNPDSRSNRKYYVIPDFSLTVYVD